MNKESEELSDELFALNAIYADSEWRYMHDDPLTYSLSLGMFKCPSKVLQLEFTFPEGYPRENSVRVTVLSNWLNERQTAEIDKIIKQIKTEYREMPQVFSIATAVNEFCQDLVFTDDTNTEQELSRGITNLHAEKSTSASFLSSELAGGVNKKSREHVAPDDANAYAKTESVNGQRTDICIFHGECLYDRKSCFQAHLAEVHCKADVSQVLEELRSIKKIATATHNVYAYRIVDGKITIEDCDDDGERGAGQKLASLLALLKVSNVLVVVTRWFGGILLSNDRFKDYNSCCRAILLQRGYITDAPAKSDKKNANSTKVVQRPKRR